MSIDIERLRKLAKAATPGPWERHCESCGVIEALEIPDPDGGEPLCAHICEVLGHRERPNAPFIAAASPDVILALLDELERLRGRA